MQPKLHYEAFIPSRFKYFLHIFSKKCLLLVQMLLWFGSWTNTPFFLECVLQGKKVCKIGLEKENWAREGELGMGGGNLKASLFHFVMLQVRKETSDCNVSLPALRGQTPLWSCKRDSIHLQKNCGSLAVLEPSHSPYRLGPFSSWGKHSCHLQGCRELPGSIHRAAGSRAHSGLPYILWGRKEKL